MTTVVLAHFDGKQSLVLDEPVDLPVGTPLRVHVEPVPQEDIGSPTEILTPVIVGLDASLSKAIASCEEFASENM